MRPTPGHTGPNTAIPPRFRPQRERVLGILARWERSTRLASAGSVIPRLTPASLR
jgi:hypothetical protein